MKVTIFDSFGAPTFSNFGSAYTHRVGELALEEINFTDWRPFGLTNFAAIIEGTLRTTVPGYYNQWYWSKGGYFLTEGFDLTYHQTTDFFGQHVGETYLEGFTDFKIYFQTDFDPATANHFLWAIPTPWGGDPRVHDPKARTYLWVPDTTATLALVAVCSVGLVALRRKLGKAI